MTPANPNVIQCARCGTLLLENSGYPCERCGARICPQCEARMGSLELFTLPSKAECPACHKLFSSAFEPGLNILQVIVTGVVALGALKPGLQLGAYLDGAAGPCRAFGILCLAVAGTGIAALLLAWLAGGRQTGARYIILAVTNLVLCLLTLSILVAGEICGAGFPVSPLLAIPATAYLAWTGYVNLETYRMTRP